jgi:hypothetical protein
MSSNYGNGYFGSGNYDKVTGLISTMAYKYLL